MSNEMSQADRTEAQRLIGELRIRFHGEAVRPGNRRLSARPLRPEAGRGQYLVALRREINLGRTTLAAEIAATTGYSKRARDIVLEGVERGATYTGRRTRLSEGTLGQISVALGLDVEQLLLVMDYAGRKHGLGPMADAPSRAA